MVDRGGAAGLEPATRPRWHPLPRALIWGALFYLATWLGTLTMTSSGLLTLASPSVGVAAVWFVFGSRRTWVWDVPVLLACVLINNLTIGVPALLLVTSPLVTLLQVAAFVAALRRLAPTLRGDDGLPRTMRTLRELAGFLVAAVVGGTVAAVTTNLTQAAAGVSTGDARFLLIRWGRNTATVVVIGAVGLILGPQVYRAIRRRELLTVLRRRVDGTNRSRRLEGLALAVVSVVLYVFCFRFSEGYPVAFLLFVTTAWVGLRFSPGTIALHSLLTGTLAVAFTVSGDGVFGQLDDPTLGAALVQLFVLVTTCTGLVLGLSREALAVAEQESTRHSFMLDSVLAEVDDGIVLMDEAENVLMINRAGRELLDLDGAPARRAGLADGTAGRDGQLTDADGRPLTPEDSPSRRALSGDEVRDQEIQVRDADGSVRRILRTSARVLPTAAEDRDSRRVLVTYHDVTADRMQREALVKFAGEVSHDLKNPLTVVSGWTDALLDEFDDGDVTSEVGRPMAKRVQAAALHMRDFIGNMLDFTVSRDQALRPLEVDLGQLAWQVAALRVDSAADGQPPDISVHGEGQVWADPLLVRVLLDNLIGNAVKYVTPGLRPEIQVCISPVDEAWVQVEVRDNGIGISPDQRARIFRAFARVDQEGYQGTGLGLAICQRIVNRHGGTIAVSANPSGTGTAFSFTLPRTEAAYETRRLDPAG